MAPEWNPICELARERLSVCEEQPRSKNLPRGSTSYFPRSEIVKVLEEFAVNKIFTCSCERCRYYAGVKGGVDERRKAVDTNELLGRYATIYGLLIYLRYPGLISLFLRHSTDLNTSHLSDGNLFFIKESEGLSTRQVEIVKKEIIESQFRFLVKTVLKRKTISTIREQEILPIQEDDTPVGTGDFGEVYAFDFPLEYTDQSLSPQHGKRFARKIFHKRGNLTKTFKEWVNHLHVNDLKHPNLMEALAAFEHGGYFSIVLDLAQCTLWDFLIGNTTVTYYPQQLWDQVHGLAEGLTYLHGQKVKGGKQPNETMFHQDLKPSNILIVDNIMKISDFGLSDYKPEPRMSESILIGDSKHEGAKVYAPPSRAGPLTDKYDVYSLGAIISEIACYDIGRDERVAQYRKKRETDCLHNQDREGSIQFYYPGTFALKASVYQEHKDLLATSNQSGDAQTEANLAEWQTKFYLQDPFKLIEKMLHFTEAERPSANEVAETLNSYIYQASRATRNIEPFNIDIWESTLSGTISRKETPPGAPNNRLRALIHEEKCGLWLYPRDHDPAVQIKQLIFDGESKSITTRDVDLKRCRPFKSIKPSYIESVEESPREFSMSLMPAPREQGVTYVFPTLREVLLFQGAMTGTNARECISIRLTYFAFLKKESKLFRKSKKDTYKSQKDVEGLAHLQIWTNSELDHENVRKEQINLAILRASDLYLVKVTNQFKFPNEALLLEDKRSNTIRLRSVEVSTLSISDGIPLNLFVKQTQRYKNYDDTGCHEAKHDEVKLTVKSESDIDSFWKALRAVREPMSGSFPPAFSPHSAIV